MTACEDLDEAFSLGAVPHLQIVVFVGTEPGCFGELVVAASGFHENHDSAPKDSDTICTLHTDVRNGFNRIFRELVSQGPSVVTDSVPI